MMLEYVILKKENLDYKMALGLTASIEDLDPVNTIECGDSISYIVYEDENPLTSGDPLEHFVAIAMIEEEHHSGKTYLHRIGVRKDHRGEGIGKGLLDELCCTHGPFVLEVDPDKDAVGFYDHLGLELLEDRGSLQRWKMS